MSVDMLLIRHRVANFRRLMDMFPIVHPACLHALLVRFQYNPIAVMDLIHLKYNDRLAEYREKLKLQKASQAQKPSLEDYIRLDLDNEDTAIDLSKEASVSNQLSKEPQTTNGKSPKHLKKKENAVIAKKINASRAQKSNLDVYIRLEQKNEDTSSNNNKEAPASDELKKIPEAIKGKSTKHLKKRENTVIAAKKNADATIKPKNGKENIENKEKVSAKQLKQTVDTTKVLKKRGKQAKASKKKEEGKKGKKVVKKEAATTKQQPEEVNPVQYNLRKRTFKGRYI